MQAVGVSNPFDIERNSVLTGKSEMSIRQVIVEKMRIDFERENTLILPTMAHLARKYGVSVSTIVAAARILRNEGVLEFGRGRRMRKVRKMEPLAEPSMAPVDRCIVSLKERISSGNLKSGEGYEKASVLSRELRVSRTTIAQTFRELSKQGLAHKAGKRWIVGPEMEGKQFRSSGASPFILCIVPHIRSWQGLSRQSRTARFCFEFASEAERYGVSFMPAYSDPGYGRKMVECRDLEGTITYIRSRKRDCLGVLFAGNERRMSDMRLWVEKISSAGIKSVWFNRYGNEGISATRVKRFRQCCYNENAGVMLAIEHLGSLGHQTILYGSLCDNSQSWQLNRFRLLQEACSSHKITLESISPQDFDNTQEFEYGRLHSFIYNPAQLKASLRRSKATAVIAPNDLAAIKIYNGLCKLGIRIPQELSLISFDNDPLMQISPISSIDFGMGYLGYCAFHYLFEILPIRHERNGDMPACPYIVHRGSTGPAATQSSARV